MPTLPMLDVAIGMTFLFLLISLICTALNEILEALLKNRATDLERGIREMLGCQTKGGDKKKEGGDKKEEGSGTQDEDYVEKLYKHPLIYSLFPGEYRSKATLWRRSLPSYIPARTFALALMDIVLPASVNTKSGTTDTTTEQTPPAPADGNKESNVQSEGSAGSDSGSQRPTNTPPVTADKPQPGAGGEQTQPGTADGATNGTTSAAQGESQSTSTSQNMSPANAAPTAIAELRAAVTKMQDDHLKRALLPLIDAAGGDLTVARENIENWYNSTMDRVAGWYKRRAQVIILVLGFLVAWGLNADAVAVCKSLLNDPALRNSVVAAAANYKPATQADAKNQLNTTLTQLEALKLPIGWDWTNAQKPTGGSSTITLSNKELACPNEGEGFWPTKNWWLKILGWFITGVAVSLGAPFWFDVLNKFMIVRSTVKPHEKSPEESSEDRQQPPKLLISVAR